MHAALVVSQSDTTTLVNLPTLEPAIIAEQPNIIIRRHGQRIMLLLKGHYIYMKNSGSSEARYDNNSRLVTFFFVFAHSWSFAISKKLACHLTEPHCHRIGIGNLLTGCP